MLERVYKRTWNGKRRQVYSFRWWAFFAWFDLWIGIYFDLSKKRVYVLPVPCFGVVIEYTATIWRCETCKRRISQHHVICGVMNLEHEGCGGKVLAK